MKLKQHLLQTETLRSDYSCSSIDLILRMITRLRHLVCLFHALLVFSFSHSTYAQKLGKLIGTIRDAATQEPLPGATVLLEGTNLGGVADVSGNYVITNIPPTSYNLRASLLGYEIQRKDNIVITTGNTQNINFELREAGKEVSEVTIRASPFSRPPSAPNSLTTLSRQEIISYPGANNDIAKVAQSIAGVSGSVGFRNDLIIRGGAPNENVYYLDGMEIPNINHFATQGSAGGPVGMLNVTFIDDVRLATSSFGARYDNPLSGVLQFRQRTGNSDRVQGNFRVGASELAATVEGPFSKKNPNTTFIASVRRSYLQFLFQLIDLPFLPGYWDYQYKVTHKWNSGKDEVNLLGLGSIDDFSFNPPEKPASGASDEELEAYYEKLAILDRIPYFDQRSNTTGLSWKHAHKNGYDVLTLSQNILWNKVAKYPNNDKNLMVKSLINSKEQETKLRYERNVSVGEHEFQFGGMAQDAVFENTTFIDSLRIYSENGSFIRPQIDFKTGIRFLKYGLFGQYTHSFLGKRLSLSLGIRADGNTFTKAGNNLLKTLSPRLGVRYNIDEKWSINASAGQYYKLPPYTILGFQTADNSYANQDVQYIRSRHLVAGLEYQPGDLSRITVEGFYKFYDHYPVSVRDSVSLANLGGNFGVLGNEAVQDVGKMRAMGVEFTFQQKLSRNFYGILAYTFYKSEATAFNTQKWAPTAWDNRHLISFTGGYKLPRNWELGLRFRFQGAAPYTPVDSVRSLSQYAADGGTVRSYNLVNSQRLRAFNAADLRIDKKWNLKRFTIDFYLDIQNLYNAQNVTEPEFTLKRNPDGSVKTPDGQPYSPSTPLNAIGVINKGSSGSLLPSLGLIIEI